MIPSLVLHQQGFVTTQQFKEEEKTRRLYNLNLSFDRDLQHSFTGSVNSLSIENDENRYLLSGAADGSLSIHDLDNHSGSLPFTGKCVHRVPARSTYSHKNSIECITWFPLDSRLFVSSGGDKILKLWDANQVKPMETFSFKERINHHQCCQLDQPLIAVGSNSNAVEIVDLRTGHKSHELKGHKLSVMALAWSPRDSPVLVSAGMDGLVKVWDVRSSAGNLFSLNWNGIGSAHFGMVNGLAFTPDGLHLLTFGADHQLRLWDASCGLPVHVKYDKIRNYSLRHVQIAADNVVFVPSKGMIEGFDLYTGDKCAHLCGHFDRVLCCVFREPYQEIYSGGSDRNIVVWTAEKCNKGRPRTQHQQGWSSDDESEHASGDS